MDVSAFNRELQGHRFDLNACFGQRLDVWDRQIADAESALRGGDHEAVFRKADQRLPGYRLAHFEPCGQLEESEPFPGWNAPVKQILVQDLGDLVGAGARTSIDAGHACSLPYIGFRSGPDSFLQISLMT